jgi:hypothetical protein
VQLVGSCSCLPGGFREGDRARRPSTAAGPERLGSVGARADVSRQDQERINGGDGH